jgi:hypothetical protein
MNDTRTITDCDAATIETTFEGRWGIWLSGTGRWWAAFRGPLSAADQAAGCVPFLRAATPGQLTRDIRAQEELRTPAAPPTAAIRPAQPSAASPSGQPGQRHA